MILKMIAKLFGIATFVITFLACIVAFFTYHSEPPFEVTDAVAAITKQEGVYVLTESRGFVGEDHQTLTIFRTLYRHGNDERMATALEGGAIVNQRDDYVLLRAIVLPPHLNGAWCSRAVVYWRPMLSLVQHSTTLPDICFEVPKNVP